MDGFYLINEIVIKEIDNKLVKKTYICMMIFSYIIMGYFTLCTYKNIHSGKVVLEKDGIYSKIYIDKESGEKLKLICDYIIKQETEGKQVIILSYKANLIMGKLKKCNGILDLPFKGNLGKEGEKGLINLISNLNDTQILIEKDENAVFWQESKIAREYIIKNFEKIGEIDDFIIYEKNNEKVLQNL